MPTVLDFLTAVGLVALTNGIIYLAGRAILHSLTRNGYHCRAFHGWYVWVWMMGGVATCGLLIPWQAPTLHGAPILIGFWCGLLGGTLHGFLALRDAANPPPDDEPTDE